MRLTDIYNVCEASHDFYQFAASVSESYSIKRLFLQRARIRQRAQQAVTPNLARLRVDPRAAAAIEWYQMVQNAIVRFDHPVFLQLLEHQESAQLKLLKAVIKDTKDRDTIYNLAQLAADMTLSRDDLVRLQQRARTM